MFINILSEDPMLYVALLAGIVLSIVLHELAHGYVAIKLGDDTPLRLKRMTFNPMVNLGPLSLILLAIVGIGWGSMPVDSSRLRGKYGDLWVSLAGPATNLAISMFFLLALVVLAVAENKSAGSAFPFKNAAIFCQWMAILNMLLTIFNLIPVPPFDGAHALMAVDTNYRNFVMNNIAFQQWGFIIVIVVLNLMSFQGLGLFRLSAIIVLSMFQAIANVLL